MENVFSKYHFAGQKNNEKILAVLHRHWFDILTQFIVVFMMLLVLFGSYALSFIFYTTLSEPLFQNLTAFLRNLFFIFTWIIFFIIWIDYYLDVWIITDRRIINIEQKGFFSRIVSELELENIQDITTNVRGVIPTFFNYGHLYVQTAAEKERFIFRNIPNPYGIKDLIMNLQNKVEQQEENQFGEMLRKKIHKETT
jgi:Bacterial PH domain